MVVAVLWKLRKGVFRGFVHALGWDPSHMRELRLEHKQINKIPIQPKKVKKALLLFFVLTESMISKQVMYFTVLVLQYC